MLAEENKNGKRVRMSVDLNVDTGTMYYTVDCTGKGMGACIGATDGVALEFDDFKSASRAYKFLATRLKDGCLTSLAVSRLVSAAQVFGYVVRGAAAEPPSHA